MVADPAESVRHGFAHDRDLCSAVVEQVCILVHSGFPVTLPIALSGRGIQLAHGFPVRNCGQSSFQQDERVDVRWGIDRELQGN